MRILAFYDLKGDQVTAEMRQQIEDMPKFARRIRFAALMQTKGYKRLCNAFSTCTQHSFVWESVDCDIPEHDRQKGCPEHIAKTIADQNPNIILAIGAAARDAIPDGIDAHVVLAPHLEIAGAQAEKELLEARDKVLELIKLHYKK